jgi:hypothetical protein
MCGGVMVGELVDMAAEEDRTSLEILKITRSILLRRLKACGEAGDANGASLIAGKLIDCVDKVARLTGEIRQFAGIVFNQQNVLNINQAPEYPELEAGLLDISRRHPAARPDVLALMEKLEAISTTPANGATYQPAMIGGEAVREIEMAAGE